MLPIKNTNICLKFIFSVAESPSTSKTRDKLNLFAAPNLNQSRANETIDNEDDRPKEYADRSSCYPHLTYKFLQPAHIMDKNKRRPDHPDYDPGK